MIVVIDYGLGNLTSVKNALTKLGIPVVISATPKVIKDAKALILPGVGAAGEGMKNLKEKGLDELIIKEVNAGKPILGICLGMQLLFASSEEGNVDCLDLIRGKVKKFQTSLKIPEIGWNQVEADNKSKLLNGIRDNSYFYFVNSYCCDPEDKEVIKGITEYDQNFCSVLEKNNIFGVQFHPEKSGDNGLQLLKNFWEAVC
jgi:glutamine amidotransferase